MKKIILIFALICTIVLSNSCSKSKDEDDRPSIDELGGKPPFKGKTGSIVIYGATACGVMAAVQAATDVANVTLICPDLRIGGMTTGGLCVSDVEDPKIIGGLTALFYRNVSRHYFESTPSYIFEPKIALEELQALVKNYPNINLVLNERLRLKTGVLKENSRIKSITMESGLSFTGDQFIDASYEGDLMVAAGVSYTYGREANSKYGETYNGMREPSPLPVKVDPYVIEGKKTSGLLPRISADPVFPGQGDNKLMAYNYRLCITKDKNNQTQFSKPDNLDLSDYEIMFRMIKSNHLVFIGWNFGKNDKLDVNSANYFSLDYVGKNYNYLEADYATRKQIAESHKNYISGLFWLIQHDPRVPKSIQNFYINYGLAKDEFEENGNWPTQLYVREGRRMISDFVMTESEVLKRAPVTDPIAMGSYPMDSHIVQYVVGNSGYLETEGQFYTHVNGAYGISYRAVVPKRRMCKFSSSNMFIFF
jgi:hypothetical protein